MNTRRAFILFHGRFPSEKAAALFAAENAKSMSKYSAVTIVVPSRTGTNAEQARTAYGLPKTVEIRIVHTPDLFRLPVLRHIAFRTSLITFTYQVYRLLQREGEEKDAVFANDLMCGIAASYTKCRLVYEVHDYPERWKLFYRNLFKRTYLVIATNQWKYDELKREFQIPDHRLLMLRNGVDVEAFLTNRSKEECRTQLGIPANEQIVVYTGHLYSWKGVDTLAAAMEHLSDIECYFVGGTESDVKRCEGIYKASNLHFVGHRPHNEMPIWQRAADALILPNTAKEEIANRYTSPMKLFEYMASGRPIVASRIPSISEVLTDDTAYLVEADSPSSLAEGIRQTIEDRESACMRGENAQGEVRKYSWNERANRLQRSLAL